MDILLVGESLIDVVRRPGLAPQAHPGGSPLNVGIGLGRLGYAPLLATWYGRDDYGAMIAAHCAESGVTILPGCDRAPFTTIAEAVIDDAGDASYTFTLDWQMPPLPVALDPWIIHTGSLGALLPPGGLDVLAYVEGRAGRTLITFDPNCRPSIMGPADDVRPAMERYVAASNLVKVSDADLGWLYPGTTGADALIERAREWARLGPGVVVLTMGEHGAVGVTRDDTVRIPADTSRGLVDTVGAGDSFMSAVIHGLATRGYTAPDADRTLAGSLDDLHSILTGAAAIAGITVSRAGANPPWLADLG